MQPMITDLPYDQMAPARTQVDAVAGVKYGVVASSNLTGNVKLTHCSSRLAALINGALSALDDVDVKVVDGNGKVIWEFYGSEC